MPPSQKCKSPIVKVDTITSMAAATDHVCPRARRVCLAPEIQQMVLELRRIYAKALIAHTKLLVEPKRRDFELEAGGYELEPLPSKAARAEYTLNLQLFKSISSGATGLRCGKYSTMPGRTCNTVSES